MYRVRFPRTLPLSTFKQEHFAQWRPKVGRKSGLKGSGDSGGRIEWTGDALAIGILSQLPAAQTWRSEENNKFGHKVK